MMITELGAVAATFTTMAIEAVAAGASVVLLVHAMDCPVAIQVNPFGLLDDT